MIYQAYYKIEDEFKESTGLRAIQCVLVITNQ